ncbi:Late embryogenesis abundant protein [Macleaya cordata]|uniref:Late embryogenesis abundant protein n=1 Tax=Macleaya cordata TaxID=56857 RepID=A0A200Q0T4_MACCD|nr:Late embryogenesis abundant protein [Macleaya cordata]
MLQEKINPSNAKPFAATRRCCSCPAWLLWTTGLVLIALILIIAGVYLNNGPQPPSFRLTILKITQFNITTTFQDCSTDLSSKLHITINVHNPNKDTVFFYDKINFTVYSDGVFVGNRSFPSFYQENRTSIDLQTSISNTIKDLDPDAVDSLKTNVYKKCYLPLKIWLRTDVNVTMGTGKTSMYRIKILCYDRIRAADLDHACDGCTSPSAWELPKLSAPNCKIMSMLFFIFK